MTIPSFTNKNGVTFTFIDGDCEEIRSNYNSNLDFDSMPGMRAPDALLFDFNGVTNIITLSGKISDNGTNRLNSGSAITIEEQRRWLNQNINGAQSGLVFTSNYTAVYDGVNWIAASVMLANFETTEITGDPASLHFTITLYVGAI